MLKVAITVDTEFWPEVSDWPQRALERPLADHEDAYARDVLGRTSGGHFGVTVPARSIFHAFARAMFLRGDMPKRSAAVTEHDLQIGAHGAHGFDLARQAANDRLARVLDLGLVGDQRSAEFQEDG